MMNRHLKIFLLCCLLLPTLSVMAEIHKWTDENGDVHFGDKPPVNAESSVIEVKINTYESPNIEALRDALGITDEVRDKVLMYSAEWCGVCKKAKRYFEKNKIKYTEYDIEKNKKAKEEFDRMGAKGVPVIIVGDKRLNGFSENTFKSIYK